MSTVEKTPWPHDHYPTERELRELMEAEELSPFSWANESGYRYPVHSHDYHRVIYCVEGSIWFSLPDERDRTIELEPGDRLDLPADVRHWAITGMEGVLCLEAHK
jgi:quercetin dioxygenase-like cupin family protein